jgi:hypothetical protein
MTTLRGPVVNRTSRSTVWLAEESPPHFPEAAGRLRVNELGSRLWPSEGFRRYRFTARRSGRG